MSVIFSYYFIPFDWISLYKYKENMRGVQNAAHSRTILSLFMTIHKFNWIIVSELVLVKKFHRLVFNFRLRFKSRSLILRFYLKLFIGYNISVWGHSRTWHLLCIHFAISPLHLYKYSLSDSLIAQTRVCFWWQNIFEFHFCIYGKNHNESWDVQRNLESFSKLDQMSIVTSIFWSFHW